MKTSTAAAIASSALLSLVSAQEQYQIDPNSVSSANRQYWCDSQITQCPLICLQPPSETAVTNSNTCDPASLAYSCVCGDGISPNVTQYTQTMPFFVCQEWGNQCVANCGQGDNTCASACRENHPCGAQDPIKPNSSTISSTMSSTASRTASSNAGATTGSDGGTIYNGFGQASSTGDSGSSSESSAAASSDSGAGRASLEFGHTFGVLALAGAFFGGFALVL